jgi:hypothetical protein
MLLDQLIAVLATLSEQEAEVIRLRFGLADDVQRTLSEVAEVFEVTPEEIQEIETHVLLKLQHPSRSDVLRDYIDDISPSVVHHFRRQYLRKYSSAREFYLSLHSEPQNKQQVFCEKHGWSISGGFSCGECPCALPVFKSGRPSLYCSNACRQAAYRRKKR